MIKTEKLCKAFGKLQAVQEVTLSIADNSIFGLAGTNGAGKSTLLRMLSGVLKPDSGKIYIDEEEVYENPEVKENLFFLPDTAYFFQNASMKEMADYYAIFYPRYDKARFHKLADNLGLDKKRKINTFSKGMKRQAALTGWILSCDRQPRGFWLMKYPNGNLLLLLHPTICVNWRISVIMWGFCIGAVCCFPRM